MSNSYFLVISILTSMKISVPLTLIFLTLVYQKSFFQDSAPLLLYDNFSKSCFKSFGTWMYLPVFLLSGYYILSKILPPIFLLSHIVLNVNRESLLNILQTSIQVGALSRVKIILVILVFAFNFHVGSMYIMGVFFGIQGPFLLGSFLPAKRCFISMQNSIMNANSIRKTITDHQILASIASTNATSRYCQY